MTRGAVDIEKLRVALRRMSRGNLLILAERAIETVPRARLGALVGVADAEQKSALRPLPARENRW